MKAALASLVGNWGTLAVAAAVMYSADSAFRWQGVVMILVVGVANVAGFAEGLERGWADAKRLYRG